MTGPRRPSPFAKLAEAPVLDPVVAKALEKTVEKPASPFAAPASGSPFAGPSRGSPFARTMSAEPGAAFSKTKGPSGKLHGASGKLRGGSGRLRQSSGRLRPKGKFQVPSKVFLVPPPRRREPKAFPGHWIGLCDYLSSFEDACGYEERLWDFGACFDFDFAAESRGVQCSEERRYEIEGGFIVDPDYDPEEELEPCPDHALWTATGELDEMLNTSCDCSPFDAWHTWGQMYPLLQEAREEAFTRAEELVDVPPGLGFFYRVAGVPADVLSVLDEEALEKILLTLLKEGPDATHGLGAAWADFMSIDFPEMFGGLGGRIKELKDQLHMSSYLPQGPEHMMVFRSFAGGAETRPSFPAGRPSSVELRGHYSVDAVGYHSALAGPGASDNGYVGKRLLYMEPWDEHAQSLLDGEEDPPWWEASLQ